MVESKYKDKLYLAKYDLDVELFSKFNLKVDDVYPLRKVFILSTDKGMKILKRIDYTLEEFKFITSAVDYIGKRFNRIMNFTDSTEEKKYFIWDGEAYCVMDYIEGRESQFSNPVDLTVASRGIGELHKASEGFRYDTQSKYLCGKTINNFKRCIQEMEFFESIAKMYELKDEFDYTFLKNIDYFKEQANKSIEILEKSQYYKLCGEEDKISICHHDLAHHNIMIKNEEAYFIDFDYCIIDLKIHDLCNFINKVAKTFDFDIDKADIILNNYCVTNDLSKRELEVLYGMLVFPEDFYSISKDYFTRRKDWDESLFIYRLCKKVNDKLEREEFLENFKQTIN